MAAPILPEGTMQQVKDELPDVSMDSLWRFFCMGASISAWGRA